MPIIVPDYSKGYGAGLESMISQMANTMAGADDDDEEEVEDGALLSAAEKRRALRDISPHMIKQIGISLEVALERYLDPRSQIFWSAWSC
ncbi:hypothetical protein FIBSPDRAFT_226609 [Athelia psychrophila]|uniref:Uncharacterized protein n=1 Tax=Athelia psychrophila TaxID=1759441 RepID=A0A165YUP4_9AGAM|nr:hypothetical protein FIBSPDRAFT_226609 [Fibularhizoctonia sp. CBS 109695]